MSLLLRTCLADMTSRGGFRWPRPGEDLGHGPGVAVAADWNPARECGGGLHGLPDGQGDASLLDWAADAVWMVVESIGAELVDLGGKVKVRSARVVFAGDRSGALACLRAAGVTGALPGDVVAAGDRGTATAGYKGTATAGDKGTATAGDEGTATAGDRGTATAGDGGTATAGYKGTATAGDGGTATAGDRGDATAGHKGTATAGHKGTATAGDRGTATAGDGGTATAGDGGDATAGDYGTATAGDGGTATAGDYGTAVLKWWDGRRYRLAVGYVGEGLLPDRPYRLDAAGNFIEVQS